MEEDEERRRKVEAGKAKLAEFRQKRAQSDVQRKQKKKKKRSDPDEAKQEVCGDGQEVPTAELSITRTVHGGETAQQEQTYTLEPESEISTTAEDCSSEDELQPLSRSQEMEDELSSKNMVEDLEDIRVEIGADGVQQLQDFEAALKQRDGIITKLTENLQQARSEKDEVMREFLQLTAQSQELQLQFQQLQAGESLRSSSISSAASDVLQARQQVLFYQQQLEERDLKVRGLQKKLEEKDGKIRGLHEQLHGGDTKFRDLEEQLVQLQQRLIQMETATREAEESFILRLQEKDLLLEQHQRRTAQHQEALAQLENRLRDSEHQVRDISQQLAAKVHALEVREAELQASRDKERLSSGEVLELMGTVEALQKRHHQDSQSEGEVLQRAEQDVTQKLDLLRAELDEMYGQQIVQMKQELRAQHKEQLAETEDLHCREREKLREQHHSEMKQLTSKLSQSTGGVNALNVRVIELQQRLQETQVLREKAEQNLIQMADEKLLLENQVHRLTGLRRQEKSQSEVHQQLQDSIRELQDQLLAAQEASADLEAKHESEIINYKIKLEMLEREKDAVLDRMAESQEAELERLRTQLLFSHEEELSRLREDLQRESLMNVENLRDELERRHGEKLGLLQEDYEQRLKAAEDQRAELMAQRVSLLQEVVTLKDNLSQALENPQVEELVSQLEELKEEIQELRQRQSMKEELQSSTELQSENQRLTERNMSLLSEVKSLQEDHEMLLKRVQGYDSEQEVEKELRAELQRLRNTFSFAENNFEVNCQELKAELEEQKIHYETKIQTLKHQLHPQQETREEPDRGVLLEKDKTELMEKLQVMDHKGAELEKQVEQKEAQLKEVKWMNADLVEQIKEKELELKRVEQEGAELLKQKEAELHTVKLQRAGLIQKSEKMELVLRRVEDEKMELQQQIKEQQQQTQQLDNKGAELKPKGVGFQRVGQEKTKMAKGQKEVEKKKGNKCKAPARGKIKNKGVELQKESGAAEHLLAPPLFQSAEEKRETGVCAVQHCGGDLKQRAHTHTALAATASHTHTRTRRHTHSHTQRHTQTHTQDGELKQSNSERQVESKYDETESDLTLMQTLNMDGSEHEECRLQMEAQRISLSQIHAAQLELLSERVHTLTPEWEGPVGGVAPGTNVDLNEEPRRKVDLHEELHEERRKWMGLQEEAHEQEIQRLRSYYNTQLKETEERYTNRVLILELKVQELSGSPSAHGMPLVSVHTPEAEPEQDRQCEIEEELARVIVQMSVEFAKQSEMKRLLTMKQKEEEEQMKTQEEEEEPGDKGRRDTGQRDEDGRDEEMTPLLAPPEPIPRAYQSWMGVLKTTALLEDAIQLQPAWTGELEEESGGGRGTCEGVKASQEVELHVEEPEFVYSISRRMEKAVQKLISVMSDNHKQLEHARLTQTELMKEKFSHDQQIAELLIRQDELQQRLQEEGAARERLTLQLQHAEGLIDGYSGERRVLEDQVREGTAVQLQLEAELQVTINRLQQLQQEKHDIGSQEEPLLRKQEAMKGGATDPELRLVESAGDVAPESGFLEEAEKLIQEKVDVQLQAQKDHAELHQQVKELEAELEEQVRSRDLLEEAHLADSSDLQQQIQALEKQLEKNRRFLDEQAADREHERDAFQQEIQQLEEQLRSSSTKPTDHRQMEELSEALKEKSDWCRDLLQHEEELQKEKQERDEEIGRLAERVRVLEETLVGRPERSAPPTMEDSKLNVCKAAGSEGSTLEVLLQTEREALDRKEKEIVNLEEQLEQFREELQNKSEEVQQLHMQLEIQRKEISTQQEELQTRTSLQTVEQKDRTLQLTENLRTEDKEVEEKKELVRELEAQVEYLRGEQEHLKRQNEEEVEQLNCVIEKLQQELSNMEPTPRVQGEEEDGEHDELKQKMEQVQKELASLQEEHLTLLSRYGSLQEERQHAQLDDLLREKTAALVVAQVQIRALEESASSRVTVLTQRVKELENCVEERDMEVKACQVEVTKAQSDAGALHLKICQLEEQLEEKMSRLTPQVKRQQAASQTSVQECSELERTSAGDVTGEVQRGTLLHEASPKDAVASQVPGGAPLSGKRVEFDLQTETSSVKATPRTGGSGFEPCDTLLQKENLLMNKLRNLELDLGSMQRDQDLQKHLLLSSEEEAQEYKRRLTQLIHLLTQLGAGSTRSPAESPTRSPAASPTRSPAASPTRSPAASPTRSPAASPTRSPAESPAESPAASPTRSPAASPTRSPAAPIQSPAATTGSHAAPAESPTESPAAPTGSHAAPAESPAAPTGSHDAPTQSPAAPTQSPAVPTGSHAAPAESPTQSPAAANGSPTGSHAAPAESQTKSPAVPTGSHAAPAETPEAPTRSPAVPAESPTRSPATATRSPAAPTGSLDAPVESPAAPAMSPATPTGSTAVSPTALAGSSTQSPAAPAGSSAAPTGSPAATTGSPPAPTGSPTESPAAATVSPAAPAKAPTISHAAPAESPAGSPTAPAESPAESPAPPTQSPAVATGSHTAPTKSHAAPTKSPAKSPAAPTESHAAPAESPTETHTAPTMLYAAHAASPIVPAESPAVSPTSPTGSHAAPAESPAAPAESPGAATGSPAGHVESPAAPTESPTKSTAASAESHAALIKSPVAPAESFAAPTKSPGVTSESSAQVWNPEAAALEELQQELLEVKRRSDDAQEELNVCRKLSQNLQEEIQVKQKMVENLQEELRRVSHLTSTEVTQELQEVRFKAQATEEELTCSKAFSRNLQEQIQEKEMMIALLKDQLQKVGGEAENAELLQELHNIKEAAAATKEELNTSTERSVGLQEQIQARDSSITQLMEELQQLRSALSRSQDEKLTFSRKDPGQDENAETEGTKHKEQVPVSRKNPHTQPSAPVGNGSSNAVLVDMGTQMEQPDLGAELEEVIGEYTEKIRQIRELHAAEIMDMENRHISESESLKKENQRLEEECESLRTSICNLPLVPNQEAGSEPAVYRDGSTSDSSLDVVSEFRRTPEGARPDDAHLPERIKALLREVHQEGMQVLALSEGGAPEDPSVRSSLLNEIQHLQTQLSRLQQHHTVATTGGVGGQVLIGGDGEELMEEECENLKVELAQVKLELELCIQTQHTHLRELDTVRAEVCMKVAQLDSVSDQLVEEQKRVRELQWELEKERCLVERRMEEEREELEDVRLALQEEKLLSAQRDSELTNYINLHTQLQVQLESHRCQVKELTSDLQKEKTLNAQLITQLQRPLQVQDSAPSVPDSVLQAVQLQLREKQDALVELMERSEQKELQELQERQVWDEDRKRLTRQVEQLQNLLQGEKARGRELESERERLRLTVTEHRQNRRHTETTSNQALQRESDDVIAQDSARTPVFHPPGDPGIMENIISELRLISSRLPLEGAVGETGSWIQRNLQEVISLLQKVSAAPPAGHESAALQFSEGSSTLTERLLRQNTELTGFVSRLTEEKNDLRNQLLRLEEEVRRLRHLQAHRALSVASDGQDFRSSTQMEVWRSERSRMEKSLRQAEAELLHLRGQIRSEMLLDPAASESDNTVLKRLYGKYLRSESFRKALIYQKKYLLLLLGGFQECEDATLSLIARLAGPHIHTHSPRLDSENRRRYGYTRFRTAARVCIAISRMHFLVRRWQKVTGGSININRNGLGPSPVVEIRIDSPYLQPYTERRGTNTRGRTGRDSPHTTHSTQHRFGGVLSADGGVLCSHLQNYDPDRALSDYISRLEALQRRLGAVQSGSTPYTPMHLGIRR